MIEKNIIERNTFQRLLEAKRMIGETKIKKKGRNAFSKYDYFTPSQITNLVLTACIENGLLGFSSITSRTLDNGKVKYTGNYSIVNVDNPEQYPILFELPTELPELKATNAAQKLGGMMTYVNRYLQMLAFDISEDALDLDDKDGSKIEAAPTVAKSATVQKPVAKKTKIKLTDVQVASVIVQLSEKGCKFTKEDILSKYDLTPSQIKTIG